MPDYLIKTAIPGEKTPTIRERIVRAKNEAQAIRHVVADTITIDRATIDEAVRLTNQGAKIETAAEAP